LVRDVLRLEIADDRRGVFVAHPGVEELIIGPLRPEHNRDESGCDAEGGDDEEHVG